MQKFILAGILAATVSMMLLSPTVGAQDGREGQAMIDVDFEGGSVADYLAALREFNPSINIVNLGPLETFEIPEVSLKNVSFDQAIGVLSRIRLRDERGGSSIQVHADHSQWSTVFTVSAQKSGSRESTSAIWSVSDLIEGGFNADDMLSAVETALTLSGEEDVEARISYHEDTHLMMAKGPHDELNLIDSVIDQLRSQPRPAMSVVAELEMAIAQREAALHDLEKRSRDLQESMEMLVRETAELRAERAILLRHTAEMEERLHVSQREQLDLHQRLKAIEIEFHRALEKAAELEKKK